MKTIKKCVFTDRPPCVHHRHHIVPLVPELGALAVLVLAAGEVVQVVGVVHLVAVAVGMDEVIQDTCTNAVSFCDLTP